LASSSQARTVRYGASFRRTAFSQVKLANSLIAVTVSPHPAAPPHARGYTVQPGDTFLVRDRGPRL